MNNFDEFEDGVGSPGSATYLGTLGLLECVCESVVGSDGVLQQDHR